MRPDGMLTRASVLPAEYEKTPTNWKFRMDCGCDSVVEFKVKTMLIPADDPSAVALQLNNA